MLGLYPLRLFSLAVLGPTLAGAAAAATATAPGFDCRHARSAVEQRICASDELSRRDAELNGLYRQIQAETAGIDGASGRRIDPLAAGQAAWLARRDACADEACLLRAYDRRIAELRRDWVQALETPAASMPVYRYERHGEFEVFIDDFRRAVAADDREAVARMSARPFADYATGLSCVNAEDGCSTQELRATRSSLTPDEFRAKYERVLSPAVRTALRERRLRAYDPAVDEVRDEDGEVEVVGPIAPGEYLLEDDDIFEQRVFRKIDGAYKLARVPFYP
ncbi:lysozyme inhibitor LprI family protein [Lysobacter antibioticus]|uniref:lysozyme inhibitor LprI family protein n=1 Tax=Lysobacter antibioticus TaxID=84531 RepID=UPI000344D469|nr:lysozyme inhibitor LprI family protein [Lysobacter antibioticus]